MHCRGVQSTALKRGTSCDYNWCNYARTSG
ncbi:unnamed protein product [Tuber melanosporum]|uniref:(Perigord truffle) hypothetical protein n=1 Tax=Tuber melanosporum (strain Mel28) TaxID=656061 RepID=D5GAE6_TUBMM|nr:uncharacterized protein GSTUM_00005131001 [Tuber melanosporum]CAZ81403.1 unnamed protein product [Tuber melanosporum]